MSRAFLIMVCAFLTLLGAGTSEARRTVTVSPRAKATAPKAQATVSPALRRSATPRRVLLQAPKSGATKATKPTKATAIAKASKAITPVKPIVRIRVKDALARLPNGERRQMIALIASPRAQGSVPVRRAVAAFLFLRGLKGGTRLPISIADMQQMTGSKRWTAKRMANLAVVLRAAVGIAKAEGLSANAAFQKALKQHGIQKQYNRGVCGA
jgi:hypothetical protein